MQQNLQQDIQKALQFQQLLAGADNLCEALIQSSSQLSAIGSQLLQIRQNLLQLKAMAPSPPAPPAPAETPAAEATE